MIPKSMLEKYKAYISSPRWKEVREKAIQSTYQDVPNHDPERGHYHCEKCQWNFHKAELEVHHLTYESLGNEKRIHLAVVCRTCHDELDAIRAKQGLEKSAEALDNARFEAWAAKVHGEDWYEFHDPGELYEDYREWIDGKCEDW